MRTITKEIKIFTLEEVFEQAVENHRYINVEDIDWYDCIIFEWKEKLKKIGFINPEIFFDGFGSQGDGACFTCDGIDVTKLAEHLVMNRFITGKEKKRLIQLSDSFSLKIRGRGTIYSHKRTKYIDLETDLSFFFNKKDTDLVVKTREIAEKLRLDLCDKIYKDLETEYEYLTSDDSVADTLRANEYEFDEEGYIYE